MSLINGSIASFQNGAGICANVAAQSETDVANATPEAIPLTIASRDANANTAFNNISLGVHEINTVRPTPYVLQQFDAYYQRVTNTVVFGVQLPPANTIRVGSAYKIVNDKNDGTTLQITDGSAVQIYFLPGHVSPTSLNGPAIIATLLDNTSVAGVWEFQYIPFFVDLFAKVSISNVHQFPVGIIVFDTLVDDASGLYSTISGNMGITAAGLWELNFRFYDDAALNLLAKRSFDFVSGNVGVIAGIENDIVVGASGSYQLRTIARLDEGDVVQAFCNHECNSVNGGFGVGKYEFSARYLGA